MVAVAVQQNLHSPKFIVEPENDTVDGRNPANQLRQVKPVVNNETFTISSGAGFLNHQQ